MKRSGNGSVKAVAVAALSLAACSGTVPGLSREPARAGFGTVVRDEAPPSEAITAAPAGTWSRPGTVPDPVAPAYAPVPAASPAVSAAAPPPSAPPPPAPVSPPPPPPAAAPMSDATAREKQLAILTDAVAALRQEISRSYEHSATLMTETRELRSQIDSLKKELSESREENGRLRSQIRTLEKKLREISTPPPEAEASGPAG